MTTVTGVVLAGGRATRMGGQDKGLVPLLGRPMVAHVLERLRPQVSAVLINANRSLEAYRAFGYPVVSDATSDFAGPLAGMAAGLAAAQTDYICTVPCDSPLVPPDLVARLVRAGEAGGAPLAVARGLGRLQPVFALLARELLDDLKQALADGERKIDRWYARHRIVEVDFSDAPDTFLNVNTPQERDALEAKLRTECGGGRRWPS